jgi:hypothetical protein
MRYLLLAALALSGTAGAQQLEAQGGRPPERIRSIDLTPGERCPESTETEVVVCYQGGSPYRIPAPLRETTPSAALQSWSNRVATMDEAGRTAGALPFTCSPIGPAGAFGCSMTRLRDWAAERSEMRRQAESVPGGE